MCDVRDGQFNGNVNGCTEQKMVSSQQMTVHQCGMLDLHFFCQQ